MSYVHLFYCKYIETLLGYSLTSSYMLKELFICTIIIVLSCKEYINITSVFLIEKSLFHTADYIDFTTDIHKKTGRSLSLI